MKRKRGQVVGHDGELLEPYPDKPKRGESRSQPTLVVLLVVITALTSSVGLIAYFNVSQQAQPVDVVLVATEPPVPTRIVPLAALAQPTLPPEWTVVPTASDTPSLTPVNTLVPTTTPTPTNTPEIRERVVTINALTGWQSGQAIIQPGEVVEITYVDGLWESWPGVGMSGPDGRNFHICHNTDEFECAEPLAGYSQAGMIGRVGDDGDMFGVGYQYSFVAETGGVLQLRINDRDTYDNSGSITMRITVKRYND